MGPRRLKGSSTLYDVKSGPVSESVNFDEAGRRDKQEISQWIYVVYMD